MNELDNVSNFYCHVQVDEKNKDILTSIKEYAASHAGESFYVLKEPLVSGEYDYSYKENMLGIFSPTHAIVFIDLMNENDSCKELDDASDLPDEFDESVENFIQDWFALSAQYKYKKTVERPDKWRKDIQVAGAGVNVENLLNENVLTDPKEKRRVKLLVSLLIGSINDAEEKGIDVPGSILEQIKKNIILFDADQTRFIYQDFPGQKTVSIQGLAGTGKTVLLMHKLAELYVKHDQVKIFFTCHNKTLANDLKERIPRFFNLMNVSRQIEWNKYLWVDRAWGSASDENSGLYSYLCKFYNTPFYKWSSRLTYEVLFSDLLTRLNAIPSEMFKPAFDYIIVDERQDFPEVFFKLCEKVSSEKVFTAGDIYQNIFEEQTKETLNVDISLSKCYRTDPRTLMFAHAVGMGLFEEQKLNWIYDDILKPTGYTKNVIGDKVLFSRQPLTRFDEEIPIDDVSVEIKNSISLDSIFSIIDSIQKKYSGVAPKDIAIIFLDKGREVYSAMEELRFAIQRRYDFPANVLVDSKCLLDDCLTITNANNAKGLEFTFVICITKKIVSDYKYRNGLYTMLTRSFLKSYLCVQNSDNLECIANGLKIINEKHYIQTKQPTEDELKRMEINRKRFIESQNYLSYADFLNKIFDEQKIEKKQRYKLKKVLETLDLGFDTEKIVRAIQSNKSYV